MDEISNSSWIEQSKHIALLYPATNHHSGVFKMFPTLIFAALALVGAGAAVVYSLVSFSQADPGDDLTGFLSEEDVKEIMQELHLEDGQKARVDLTAEMKRKSNASLLSSTTTWTNVPVWRTAHQVHERSPHVFCYVAEPGSHELILQPGEKPLLNGRELCINCHRFTEADDAECVLRKFLTQARQSEQVKRQISEQLA
jgi:hypothetical protein